MFQIKSPAHTRTLAQIPEFIKGWAGIGLPTSPTDPARAEASIRLAYRLAGLPEPRWIIGCADPLSGALAAAAVMELNRRHLNQTSVIAALRDVPMHRTGARLRAVLGQEGEAYLAQQISAPLDSTSRQRFQQVQQPLFEQCLNQWKLDEIPDSVLCAADRLVRRMTRSTQHEVLSGQGWRSFRYLMDDYFKQILFFPLDMPDLALYDFARQARLLDEASLLTTGLIQTAQQVEWIMPFPEVCWVGRYPTVLELDSANRLHNDRGPVLSYRRGLTEFMWHGVRVPELVIMHPEAITPALIDGQRNVEVRRVMLERYGLIRYISATGEIFHQDETGMLIRHRSTAIAERPGMSVRVINSTPEPDGTFKEYLLRVPPNMETARQAVAWTFGLNAEDYQPLVET